MRHADDHIHLMATLVSETSGKRFHPYRDYPKLRTACQQLEREFGLVATASADKTAAPASSRAEKAKAGRLGRRLTAREELRQRVRRCAAATRNGPDFLAALTDGRLDPQAVHDASGRVVGYTVALPYDRSATGSLIRYSGTQLAPDLTWPKLVTRWAGVPPLPPRQAADRHSPAERRDILEHCARAAFHAKADVQAGRDVDGIAHAAGELLTLLGHGTEDYASGSLTVLAATYDRAARTPYRVVPSIGAAARELRHAARQLGAVGPLINRRNEKLAVVALTLALASLVAEVAAWQQQRGRTHQAAAARTAAGGLAAVAATSGPPPTADRPKIASSSSPVTDQPQPRARPAVSGTSLAARPRPLARPPEPRSPGRSRR